MEHRKYTIVWIVLLGWLGSIRQTAAQVDTMVYSLDSVVVSAKRHTSHLKGNINSTIQWDMDMLHNLPKILGNANPLHYTQLLPGVQTCSEYNSGLYIQGCDNAHNLVSIEGIPIYNASHLLGFFSVFNASHFSRMDFSKTAQNSSSSNRLGGILNMRLPDSVIQRTSGEYIVGPMSSQGTLRVPMGKSSLFVSLRTAYLNLLYGQWLKIEDNQLSYNFSDYNATYIYAPNPRNQIRADIYAGFDDVNFTEKSYMATNQLKWHNEKFSVDWKLHWNDETTIDQTLYYTSYHNRFHLNQASLNFNLPSSISDFGYKGVFKHRQLQIGTDLIYHQIQPQNPQIDGSYQVVTSKQPKQNVWETAASIDYDKSFSRTWAIRAGTRFTYYHGNNMSHTSLNPMLTLAYSNPTFGNISLNYRTQHQYLFQTGFTNMGLPTEFWFAAGKDRTPQLSRSLSITYDIPLFNGNYKLYIECYYKKLYNQVEYNGNLFDFLNSVYSLDNSLLKGNGKNYGINIMFNKQTGKLTGWISYTWGRSLRKYTIDKQLEVYPANHERIHELNAIVTCNLTRKWSIGATSIFASGTPFTSPKHVYLLGNHILAEYNKHNASRLNPYFRLDFSMNYNLIKKHNQELGFNFSLYNVTSHSNDLYHRFSFNETDKSYVYKPVHFVLNILPSFSIYHKF